MKILILSNIYPPVYVGGYELGCRDAVDALRAKGHDVIVLTSRFPEGVSRVEGHVHRKLTMFLGRPEYWKVLVREVRNQSIFRKYCREYSPDIVFFWKIADLSLSFIDMVREMRLRHCFYVFDDWIADWNRDRLVQLGDEVMSKFRISLPGKILGFRFSIDGLQVENAIFASRYLQEITENGVGPMKNAEVLPWGLDTSRYHPRNIEAPLTVPSRLLFVGQIVEHKGVHIAIKALAIARRLGNPNLQLTIVGDTRQAPEYFGFLQKLVDEMGLHACVRFTGKVERDLLPEIYRQHDIFIFSSLWDEPFGLTPLEAMSCGLVVVGTGTGGSAETLVDTCALLYERADPQSCAAHIDRLAKDSKLFEVLRSNSLERVRREYDLSSVIERLDEILSRIAISPPAA